MQEIKFRAWHKSLKQMYLDGWHGKCVGESGANSTNDHINFLQKHDIELMQYTGLKDKDGREIYEGDIVASGRFKEGIVMYGDCGGGGPDEGFRTMGFYVDDKGWDKGLLDIEPIEVKGNIYENPELIEAKQ
jgi:hypothetical protein